MPNLSSRDPGEGIGQKLLTLWHEKGVSGSLMHIRTILLHRLHERLSTARASNHEVVPTTGKVELRELTVDSDNEPMGVHYAPTPRLVFRWLHDLLPTNIDDTAFIDVGAGRGRIVMMAMEHPYARVIGCEFAKELVEEARQNIASLPKDLIKARSVEIVHIDATELNAPDLPCVFFLFNPFGADVMQKFLNNVLKDYADNPRAMMFIYLNPLEERIFENLEMLVEKKIPLLTKLKLALFSPYTARIYVAAGLT